jgi:hypothetical protein
MKFISEGQVRQFHFLISIDVHHTYFGTVTKVQYSTESTEIFSELRQIYNELVPEEMFLSEIQQEYNTFISELAVNFTAFTSGPPRKYTKFFPKFDRSIAYLHTKHHRSQSHLLPATEVHRS